MSHRAVSPRDLVARRPRRGRTARGYALMFVIMVAVALGIIVGGLFAFLAETVSSSKQSQEELQQLYGCDGALRLAFHEASQGSGDVEIARLQQSFGILSSALQADINPRTGRPYADLEGIEVKSSGTQALQATKAPFHGMQFVQEGFEFIVTANPNLSRGRTCRAQSQNRLRTISYFQFALASNDIVLNRPSSIGSLLQVTPGTTGDVYTLQHSAGSPGRLRQRRTATSRGSFTVHDIHIADKETFRPVPPSGQPWSFINKKKRTFGGTKRRTKHKRPQLEYFVKYPTNTPGIDPTLSRFAMQADIRIIDGEWFLPNAFGSYPGARRWSDRPSGRVASRQLMYSAYETQDGRSLGGAAVIRYGLIGADKEPRVSGICADPAVMARIAPEPPPTVNPKETFFCDDVPTLPASGVDPHLAAAKEGFFDPYLTDRRPTPILPIILDVARLVAAMQTEGTGDLGDARCLGENPVLCPETRRFDGSLWVGTLPAGMTSFNGTPITPTPEALDRVFPDGTPRPPCPLDAEPGANDCVRPNAVVIVNGQDLRAFQRSGLSIASNLPMYVIGGFNDDTPDDQRTTRVALMAPSITGLSSDFDLSSLAWSKGETLAIPNKSETLSWHASLFTAWPSSSELKRDPSRHLLRRLQGELRIDVTGSVVAMFRRRDYDKIQTFNSRKGSFSSPRIDPLIVGLPMFVPHEDNPEEENGRLAPGTIRYPGEESRDLRRSPKEHQPPAAPRFSIDPAPIDRR